MPNPYVDHATGDNNQTIDIYDAALRSTIGQSNGIATLDNNGKLTAGQLPSDSNKLGITTLASNGETEATTTATMAHAKDSKFYLEATGEYCMAKTAIAIGDTLVKDTNYTVITINGFLTDLEAYLILAGQTLDTKADKVSSATNGNLAGLNGSGNLTDSGVAASEIPALWKSQGEYGVKNLIPYPYIQSSQTQNGVTFTSYSDGSVLVNGTATADSSFEVLRKSDDSLGGYWMTGGKSAGLYMRQRIVAKSGGTFIRDRRDIGNGIALDNIDASTEMYYILVYVKSGTSVNNETIYPMIRVAADTDETYRPYAKTNKQLTDEVGENTEDIDTLENRADNTTTSISGNPISISGLKANQLAVNPIITFEPIQAGSGTPSPVNQRPISGYDKVEALSCGVNTITKYQKGGIENDGTENTNTNSCRTDFIKVIPNSSYYFIKDTNLGGSAYYIYYDSYKNFISYNSNLSTGVLNIPNNVGYVRFQFYLSGSGWGTNLPNRKDGLNYPATQTSYVAPIKATSISESLGQTVYGGSLDLRSGKLTVKYGVVDLGDLTWDYSAQFSLLYANMPDNAPTPVYGGNLAICSMYDCYTGSYSGQPDKAFTLCNTSWFETKTVAIKDTSYSDPTAFKTAVTGQKLVYPLATPTEIQLTPHEISLLKDYAYLSTNGTSIALDYHNGEMASLADVSQLGETVNELGNKFASKSLSASALRLEQTYTSASNLFVVPEDGYIFCFADNVNSQAVWYFTNESGSIQNYIVTFPMAYASVGIFVKKGAMGYAVSNGAAGVAYRKLEDK